MSLVPLALGLALIANSALEGYRPFDDAPVAPWKQVNDAVRDAGGWRAYAREAQPTASSPAAAPARPVSSSASSPHAGHH